MQAGIAQSLEHSPEFYVQSRGLPGEDKPIQGEPGKAEIVGYLVARSVKILFNAFLKKHNRLEEFDKPYASIVPYPRMAVPNNAYRTRTQWQGKEMGNLSQIILGALMAALRNPKLAVKGDFVNALKCVQSLIEFHLMAQYGSHTISILNYMERYLNNFYKNKDIFLEMRAYQTTVKDAKNRTKTLNASGSQSVQLG
ncbi:uncharacterized protein H6S33_008159 [Morchella sextelata]|uniref:uncharacterized protein n=1 Tax=Morchella sextelata TaxID=1174677 RepID=UPI001D050F06|nr:uncharacterized protein H6S33_008159 [Morchella sextelata]KAH0603155.1 hypothetical protein H6S33_008159 [Morchella sextelata]